MELRKLPPGRIDPSPWLDLVNIDRAGIHASGSVVYRGQSTNVNKATNAELLIRDGTLNANGTGPGRRVLKTNVGNVTMINVLITGGTLSNGGALDIATEGNLTLPAQLSEVSWSCDPQDGASCTAMGTGDIDTPVDLPAGSEVVFTVSATVNGSRGELITNTSTVSIPVGVAELDSSNNRATDESTIDERIFLDGFE